MYCCAWLKASPVFCWAGLFKCGARGLYLSFSSSIILRLPSEWRSRCTGAGGSLWVNGGQVGRGVMVRCGGRVQSLLLVANYEHSDAARCRPAYERGENLQHTTATCRHRALPILPRLWLQHRARGAAGSTLSRLAYHLLRLYAL